MHVTYLRYSISLSNQDDKDIATAMLSQWGIEGFEELEEYLLASGPVGDVDAEAIEAYLAANEWLFTTEKIEPQNWNEVWESNFEPIQVGDFVGVRAHFHPPFTGVRHQLQITPKMSFGTGHHATTYLMMLLMEKMPFPNSRVFDFGTGTGILAILAEQLGACELLAIDNDPWCIENTIENIANNEATHIKAVQAEKPPNEGDFDVILANINKNIILEHLDNLNRILVPGGQMALSGLLLADADEVIAAVRNRQLKLQASAERNGWVALVVQKELL